MSDSQPSVIILGATSAMARAAALAFAEKGYAVVLGARDREENERIAVDLRVRCAVPVHTIPFDALEPQSHPAFVAQCEACLGCPPDGVVLCFGHMIEQTQAQQDFAGARRMVDSNYTGAISITELFAASFEARRSGFIGLVSSVAGDRGRQSNYIYGSSKAALSTYAQGLRSRMFKSGVSVTTIKPGFVDTKMVYGLPLPERLVASPEQAGRDIVKAILAKKDTAYVPFFWRYIMLLIKLMPEWKMKRSSM